MRFKEDNGTDFELSKVTVVILIYIKGSLSSMHIFGDSTEAASAADHCADRPSSIPPSRPDDGGFLDTVIGYHHCNPDLVNCWRECEMSHRCPPPHLRSSL